MIYSESSSSMSSSVGQFWYWKFNFSSLENQVSRSFAGSYSSTSSPSPLILMSCSKVGNRKAMNLETVFWRSFSLQQPLLISLLQPSLPDWHLLFQHCQWMMILIAYLLLWHYHLFSLKSLIISTAGTFSHIYVCTRHINKINIYFTLELTSISPYFQVQKWLPIRRSLKSNHR